MSETKSRRLTDITVAGMGLTILSPVITFALAGVALTTGRWPIFKQTRYGMGGRPFNIYKIKSMREAFDSLGCPLRDHQRLTKFGSFLRKTGLDELPQLWNILKGDMSFVGPRPMAESPSFDEWSLRYNVKPGLFGLSAVREKEKGEMAPVRIRLKNDLEWISTDLPAWKQAAWDISLAFRAAKLVVTARNELPPPRNDLDETPNFSPSSHFANHPNLKPELIVDNSHTIEIYPPQAPHTQPRGSSATSVQNYGRT